MADWDADSPGLRQNLIAVLRDVRDRAAVAARHDGRPDRARQEIRRPFSRRGRSRDDARVGRCARRRAPDARRLRTGGIRTNVTESGGCAGRAIPRGEALDIDGLAAVINLCAWAHAEWVRIHPFANGNGRTARIWANALLMRYGLPPAIRLRPRPDGGYGDAGVAAMNGDWRPTAAVFKRMLAESLAE